MRRILGKTNVLRPVSRRTERDHTATQGHRLGRIAARRYTVVTALASSAMPETTVVGIFSPGPLWMRDTE